MTRCSAIALLAGLLAGGATPPQPAPTMTAAARQNCKNVEPPTGSHIADPVTCGRDPFVKHGVFTDRSGSPSMAQGNPQR